MIKKIFIVVVSFIVVILLSQCAGTFGKGNSSDIVVQGVVLTPTNEPVINADVRSMPPSEITVTDNNGKFIIKNGLRPGKYEFFAETAEGNKGSTLTGLAYSASGPMRIKIILGMRLDMKTLNENRLREDIGKTRGEKRVGEK